MGEDPTVTTENRNLSPAFRMGAVFQGVMAGYRHTELLAETDLSKVFYACGTTDRRIGRLTPDEVGSSNRAAPGSWRSKAGTTRCSGWPGRSSTLSRRPS